MINNLKLKNMKTLFLLGALTIGGFTVSAQEASFSQNGIQHNAMTEVISVADEFTEISVSEVPKAIMDAIAKNYPTANVEKAYINEEEQYKLSLSLEDGTKGDLFADKDGNWLDM